MLDRYLPEKDVISSASSVRRISLTGWAHGERNWLSIRETHMPGFSKTTAKPCFALHSPQPRRCVIYDRKSALMRE